MRAIPKKDKIFVGIQFLLFAIYFIPIFSIPIPDSIQYVGLAFVVMGIMIAGISLLQLNTNLTPFPTPKDASVLVTNGIFKFIRHPVYSGVLLIAFGYALYCGSLWKIAVSAALWLLLYSKSRYEESILADRFPAYHEYCRVTPRFFPFL